MEKPIKYSNSNNNTQCATFLVSEVGVGVLKDMQERLYLASNELLRMEDESGIALTNKQTAAMNTYYAASKRIKKLLFISGYRSSEI